MRNEIFIPKQADCPFCNLDSSREIIFENHSAFCIYDKFPVNNGHVLIIPKRHCGNYFDLTSEEICECWSLVNDVEKFLCDHFNPDGFNLGVNVNEAAGQTINHVHIHLIPRYSGDTTNPKGGVRGVIPSKMSY